MEHKVLDEKVEWEARRVGAAFGIAQWSVDPNPDFPLLVDFRSTSSTGVLVQWGLTRHEAQLQYVCAWISGESQNACLRNFSETYWQPTLTSPYHQCNELMAHALYRLGIEDEDVLSQLPELTAHEKLELRLSFPREFWPQKWLDEEEAK